MNIKDRAYISAFYNGANFGTLNNFFDCFDNDGNFINEEITSFDVKKILISEFDLLFKGYKNIKDKSIIENFYVEDNINTIFEKILESIVNIFELHNVEKPKLFIVDKLPEPFSSKQWSAMSVDKNDGKLYNINWGIYFKREKIRHCYFEPLVAHELMHWVINQFTITDSDDLYCPIIEEGLCDVMGSYMLLKSNIMAKELIYNFYALNRAGYPRNELATSYWDSCKLILVILLSGGIDKIINIIKSGRNNINKIDINSLKFSNISEKGELLPDLLNIIEILVKANTVSSIGLPEYIVFTNTYRREFSLMGITEELKLSKELVAQAINTLNNKGLLFMESEERIFNANDKLFGNYKYYI